MTQSRGDHDDSTGKRPSKKVVDTNRGSKRRPTQKSAKKSTRKPKARPAAKRSRKPPKPPAGSFSDHNPTTGVTAMTTQTENTTSPSVDCDELIRKIYELVSTHPACGNGYNGNGQGAGAALVAEEPIEEYEALGGSEMAPDATAGFAAAAAPYTIRVRFMGGLTPSQKNAFRAAANRWTRIITTSLPAINVDGEVVTGILILAQGQFIDGPGRVLGQAGPTHVRPSNAGAAAYLPAKGQMKFDTADLQQMEARGTLTDVITHEMGHTIGIGTVWEYKRLVRGLSTGNPTFVGTNAMREYGALRGTGPSSVPVENTGGSGTFGGHWRESVFRNELMSGYISSSGNPISRMTVGSLQDLGYVVNYSVAEPYVLPNHLHMAEAGGAMGINELEQGEMLTQIPIVLPASSLVP